MADQLETLRFPFLGAREDGEPFEYLLLEIDQERAHIAVFNWMVNHLNLNLHEKVDLFIPLLMHPYQFADNAPGIVSTIKKAEHSEGHFYEILFNPECSLDFSVNRSDGVAPSLLSKSSLTGRLIKLIKDSLILKEGILVYLKHLTPYFSRILDFSQENYNDIQLSIFDDIKSRIKNNEESLNQLYISLKELDNPANIPIMLNLEYLRENIESEISLDLFMLMFANLKSRSELITLLRESKYQEKIMRKYAYMNYLISIKELEKRLYSNYNQIVLIYIQSITNSISE